MKLKKYKNNKLFSIAIGVILGCLFSGSIIKIYYYTHEYRYLSSLLNKKLEHSCDAIPINSEHCKIMINEIKNKVGLQVAMCMQEHLFPSAVINNCLDQELLISNYFPK
jgi:hypothetical protein